MSRYDRRAAIGLEPPTSALVPALTRCRDLNVRASRSPSPQVLASVIRENRPCPVGQLARVGSMVEPTTTVSEIEADDADNRVLENPVLFTVRDTAARFLPRSLLLRMLDTTLAPQPAREN